MNLVHVVEGGGAAGVIQHPSPRLRQVQQPVELCMCGHVWIINKTRGGVCVTSLSTHPHNDMSPAGCNHLPTTHTHLPQALGYLVSVIVA